MPEPTIEGLRGSDETFYRYFIDLYHRLGRVEGIQKAHIGIMTVELGLLGTILIILARILGT